MPTDPRFEEEQLDLTPRLTESALFVQLFRVEGRTCLRDFLPGLVRIDERFAKYANMKGDQWRTDSVDTHMIHAMGHLQQAISAESFPMLFKNLTATALRSLAGITCLCVRYAKVRESVSTVRASTLKV